MWQQYEIFHDHELSKWICNVIEDGNRLLTGYGDNPGEALEQAMKERRL